LVDCVFLDAKLDRQGAAILERDKVIAIHMTILALISHHIHIGETELPPAHLNTDAISARGVKVKLPGVPADDVKAATHVSTNFLSAHARCGSEGRHILEACTACRLDPIN
jgi:hypothetical protein